MHNLVYPFSKSSIRALSAGDVVSVNGIVWTGRDRFHKHFSDGGALPVDFRDGALYHCGPVVVPDGDAWRVVAAGPTTSVRENPYEPRFIAATGLSVVIGKGGMDERTLEACRRHGAVYLQAVGGAVAHNSISLIIPCHRVVGAGGSLTGYAGGIARKAYLLQMENALGNASKLRRK